jgi:hypothetical protein
VPTEGGVVGDPDLDAEQIRERSQRTLDLAKRLMKYQAKRQSRFDGDVEVDGLTASLSGCRRVPCRYRFLGRPNGEAASSYQRSIVFRPVRHPVSGCRDLMAAPLVELVWHGFPSARDNHPIVRDPISPSVRHATYSTFMHQRLSNALKPGRWLSASSGFRWLRPREYPEIGYSDESPGAARDARQPDFRR